MHNRLVSPSGSWVGAGERVAILVLNYSGWRYTVECLESLGHLRHREFWVVLVDNGSTDDSVDQIRAWARGEVPVESPFFKEPGWAKPVRLVEYEGEPSLEQVALEPAAEAPYVTLIRLPENRGFAAGNNVAIRYALARGAEWTWLLNNDTVVTPDSLTEMLRAGLADPRVGIVGCKLLYYDRPDTIQAAGGGRFYFWLGIARHYGWMQKDDGRWDRPFEPHYVTGASMLVRAQCWQKVGFLDEAFFFYAEETEWQLRARRKGYTSAYAATSRVYHREGATVGRANSATDFFATRSALRLCAQYARFALPTVAGVCVLRALRRLTGGEWARARAIGEALFEHLYAETLSRDAKIFWSRYMAKAKAQASCRRRQG
jgi:GT2 family glycosyltransferase